MKRNHRLKIVKLEKTCQFSSLKSLEHQYLKQFGAPIFEAISGTNIWSNLGTNNLNLFFIKFIFIWAIIEFWVYFRCNIFKRFFKLSLFSVWNSKGFSSFVMLWFQVWLLGSQSLRIKDRKFSTRIVKPIVFNCNPSLCKCFLIILSWVICDTSDSFKLLIKFSFSLLKL